MSGIAPTSDEALPQAVQGSPRLNELRRWKLLLLGLFCLQGMTLLSFYCYSIQPFPPEAYDQAAYLTRVYELADAYDTFGLGRLLHVLLEGGAQGVLLIFEGAALEVGLRFGRLAPLLINFASLLAVELALSSTLVKITGRFGLPLSALGLFLSAHSMWFWAGGMFDFRIDWLASCLYGTWACLVLRSGVFEDRFWSIAAAGIAALLILTRFITATYLFGVQGVLVAIFFCASPWLPTRRRVVNGLMSLAVTGVVVLPFILDSIAQIYAYYVVGHLTGSEKGIRAAEAGVSSLSEHLLYYPRSILRDHLGPGFALVLTLFAVTVLAAAVRRRGVRGSTVTLLAESLFLAGAVAGPVVVLTVDQAKSPVVGSVVVVPIVLLLTLLPRWLGIAENDNERSRRLLAMPVGGALCFGLGLFLSLDANATSRPSAKRHDFFQWGRLITDVAFDALGHANKRPKIFFNTLSSHFFAPAFSAFAYERTGSLILFDPVLNDSIFAPAPEWVLERLRTADYVVISAADKVGVYPVFGVLTALDPAIKDWAEHHLRLAWSYTFDGGNVDVYVRS